jgi:hypothetical protein
LIHFAIACLHSVGRRLPRSIETIFKICLNHMDEDKIFIIIKLDFLYYG